MARGLGTLAAIEHIRINTLEFSLIPGTSSVIWPKASGYRAHGLSAKHSDSRSTEATLRKVVNEVQQNASPTTVGILPFLSTARGSVPGQVWWNPLRTTWIK